MFSKNISTKWANLARLLNIPPEVIEDVQLNVAKYPDIPSKAVKILELFNADPNADMNKLHDALHDLQIKVPHEKLSVHQSDPKLGNKTSSSDDNVNIPQRKLIHLNVVYMHVYVYYQKVRTLWEKFAGDKRSASTQ